MFFFIRHWSFDECNEIELTFVFTSLYRNYVISLKVFLL
jgi:hypothetical protein